MIRFVLRRSQRDNISGASWTQMETIDLYVPELEQALSRGGRGEQGHDLTELIGVEFLGDPQK